MLTRKESMPDSTFDDALEEIRSLVSARAADLDARWAELIGAVHELANEARKVGRIVESEFVELEEGRPGDPSVYGQLVINRSRVGFWIPDPYSNDPHDLYGHWTELEEVANDYKLLILKAELHRSLAQALLTSLRQDEEVIQRPISKNLLARSEPGVADVAESLGWSKVAERWKRAVARGASRPEEATTLARTLVEDVAKHILEHHGESVPSELKGAVKSALTVLGNTSKVNEKMRGGLQTLEQAIFAARNDKGDAHGSAPSDVLPTPTEAQLYVTVAGGIAAYLMALQLEKDQADLDS